MNMNASNRLLLLISQYINILKMSFITATWVGGAFIIGVAESVYDPTKGLIWALVPLQVSISFVIGKTLLNTHRKSL